MKGIVVNFRAGDDRNLFIQQLGELANDAALRLSAQAEQNELCRARIALTSCGMTVSS